MNDPASFPAGDIVALIFPIVAVIMGIGVVMIRAWLDYRRRRELFQLHHAERMSAIEKGLDVPALPPEFFREHHTLPRGAYLYRGLVWLFVGVGLGIAILLSSQNGWGAAWSFVPIGVGVANILYYFFAPAAAVTAEPEVRKPTDTE